ncbi:MAG: hypothetical protein P4L79_10085 [Legionella sp.]|uniref:hypothetical protein n=1 Tax=Legionella sp. TaxID=459 RepID=UPI002851775D|nr:hypothetical protein [Legionella sp.]
MSVRLKKILSLTISNDCGEFEVTYDDETHRFYVGDNVVPLDEMRAFLNGMDMMCDAAHQMDLDTDTV